jgi:geranylgeranyl diphosphate synthase type I
VHVRAEVAPSPEFPGALLEVTTRAEELLGSLLQAETERWVAIDPALGAPVQSLADFVAAGGKRIRPACCVCGFLGAGGDADDPALERACAALELVHTFALVHDDVMDGSALRRGRPTVHRAFSEEHERQRWQGEARRFGEGVAILVGDFAHVYADRLMHDAPAAARDLFDELRLELCVGQALDLIGTVESWHDLDTARRIATYKSGKYTVERPLHVGAALAGANPAMMERLTAIGLPLGEAFQLRDDLLGAFGEPEATGKPVGDDLREGKPTPLLAIAHRNATASQRDALDTVGRRDLDDDGVARIQAVLLDTGAVAEIEALITDRVADAIAAIDAAELAGDAADLLRDLAHYLAWRDR